MDKKTHSRRSFLNALWLGLGGVAVFELLVVIFSFFRPRKAPSTGSAIDTVVVAGPVDRFEPGTVNAFVQGKFYLARLEDGGFLAMSRRCTHLSCTVPWVSADNKFVCPCHASEFDIGGEVIQPPAPRALDLYPVKIRNNVVSVDTGTLLKRSVFKTGQVSYPKKT